MSTSFRTKSLPAGRFFGEVRTREEHRGFALTYLRHAHGARLPRHEHANAWFCLLQAGGYAERYGRHEVSYAPRSVLFHPPGVAHRDEIGPGGAAFLIVEVGGTLVARATERGPLTASVQDLRGGDLVQAARRLDREWRDPARRAPLVIEGLVLEMLGLVCRRQTPADRGLPSWLGEVIDRLRAEFSSRLTLQDLADGVGVHPVRLSRTFRRRMGCGIGEYVQVLRVRRVESGLTDPEANLADLAIDAGFVDQSHMTRVFRRITGVTPGSGRSPRRARA